MKFLKAEEFYLNTFQFAFLLVCGYTFGRSELPVWCTVILSAFLAMAVAYHQWSKRQELIEYVDNTLDVLRKKMFSLIGPFAFSAKLDSVLSEMDKEQQERLK